MELTSAQVHWIGGVAFVIVAGLLIGNQAQYLRARWIPWLLPVLLVGYGIESGLDWWIHGDSRPEHYLPQALQHLLQGSAMLIAGLVEGARLSGRLQKFGWGLVLPAALGIVGVGFWIHSQHATQVDPMVMLVQHRAFTIALVAAALMRVIEQLSPERAALRGAWLAPLLIFGGLLMIYTETDGAQGDSSHPMSVPALR